MKERLLGAFIMLVITIPLILLGGNYTLALVVLLSCISLYELFKLKKYPLLLKCFGYLIICYMFIRRLEIDNLFISIIMAFYLLSIVIINDKEKYNIEDALMMIDKIIFISISYNLIISIRNMGLETLIYIIIIAILTDTFAYITGNLVGTKHLFPKISPKKTLEGCIGGLVMGTFFPVLFYYDFINVETNIFIVIVMTFTLSLLAQLGDLVFSSIKRYYNIKDFGNIIPGHGGILDRLDSIIFVTIGFKIFLSFL